MIPGDGHVVNVVVRTDASFAIGTGHVRRCLTLAGALRESGAEVSFVAREHRDHLCDLVVEHGFALSRQPQPATSFLAHESHGHAAWLGAPWQQDAEQTLAAIDAIGVKPDWLVVDHYSIDQRWERALRPSVGRIMVIDDLADRSHECDLLLDQNLYADVDMRYRGKVPSHCQLLLGPRFALLRDEFRQLRGEAEPRSGPVKRVMVCFGGVDADNHTISAIEALARIGDINLSVDVVIGAEHSDREHIESACVKLGYQCHVQTSRMAELMAAADLAIGAGGATTWERCCVGLPALVLAVAENQRKQVRDAAAESLVYAPDVPSESIVTSVIERHICALMENISLRHAISQHGMRAVDGRGIWRVIRHIGCCDIELREAGPDDSQKLFEWRNHPSIREASRNHEVIDWHSHQQWFASVQSNPERILLIGQRSGVPLGVVRFDIQRDEAEVSIYLVPGSRAPGTGSQLLHQAERWLVSSRPDVRRCRAHVLGTNVPSHRLFTYSGYEIESTLYSKRLIPA